MPIHEHDKWAFRAPHVEELTERELREDFLSVAQLNSGAFSDWEQKFCADVRHWLKWDGLTFNQARILEKGLLAKLWTNDPDLWKDCT